VISQGYDAGAVISASHNPYQDNGIKFFGPEGFKFTAAQGLEMEKYISHEHIYPPLPTDPGQLGRLGHPVELYVETLLSRLRPDLGTLRVALDCANGATYQSSPLALKNLGSQVSVICDQPNGFNINERCGSTHISTLAGTVKADGFDAGFAFDGDGDRMIAVDESGEVVDGDFVMAICARHLKEQGKLPGDTIVTTVMTNLGFHLSMKELGIKVVTTDVGDRYVLEEMLAGGFVFGGEQSGHIINLETGTTGDGLATCLLLLQVMTETGLPLSELARVMERLPQKLVNVRVGTKKGLAEETEIWNKVEEESDRLGETGRVLVRPSGTEPVVRVMVEAATARLCDEVAASIAEVVEQRLGV
jgi:phosphoglucosamine mutase